MRSRLAGHSGGRARLLYVQRRVWMRAPMALDLEKQRAPSPGRPGSPASSERRLKVTADGASAPQQHQQPAAQPAPAAGSTPPLKFSIERILSSEFGPTGGRSVPTAAAVAKGSQQPRKEDRTISERATTPPQPNNQQGLLWPAWVYCTRYSDRPSSGERTFYTCMRGRGTREGAVFQRSAGRTRRRTHGCQLSRQLLNLLHVVFSRRRLRLLRLCAIKEVKLVYTPFAEYDMSRIERRSSTEFRYAVSMANSAEVHISMDRQPLCNALDELDNQPLSEERLLRCRQDFMSQKKAVKALMRFLRSTGLSKRL
ncbi:hypothetical protein HPB51_014739 [Rhipicephalus microplus]|uniref:Uncharacterized protein n=1 Tax=Rhipicephalus microplus TaxID=6941 RepID=A0A9J6DNU9_RHIMP|nr:hypothetical protein HPB51_014739 [Rhipicephalus microplus]